MAQHTAGPWKAIMLLDGSEEVGIFTQDGTRKIGETFHPESEPNSEGAPDWVWANARVMAAGPQLLDACRMAAEDMSHYTKLLNHSAPSIAIAMAATGTVLRDAIKKAGGR